MMGLALPPLPSVGKVVGKHTEQLCPQQLLRQQKEKNYRKGESKKGNKIDESLESTFYFVLFWVFFASGVSRKYFAFSKKSISEAKVTSGSISHPETSLCTISYRHPASATGVSPGGWGTALPEGLVSSHEAAVGRHLQGASLPLTILHPGPAGTH